MSRIERVVVYGVLGLLILHALVGMPLLAPRRAEAGDPALKALKVVEAEEFRVVDKGGRSRVSLAMKADDEPSLTLFDRAGRVRCSIGIGTDDGTAVLSVLGQDGKSSVSLSDCEYPSSPHQQGLSIYDKEGKVRVRIEAYADGSPILSLSDGDQRDRAVISLLPNGSPSFSLHDKDGKVIWGSPSK